MKLSDMSEEQKKTIAIAISQGGKISIGRIDDMYSGDCSDSVKKMENNNLLIKDKDEFGMFRVPIKDVKDDGKIVFQDHIPQELVNMGKKIDKRKDLREKDKEARKKLKEKQNNEDSFKDL